MSYLKMALKAMEAAICEGEGRDHTPPAKTAKLHPLEPPQASPETPPATCESCPCYDLNPWTHYPDFGAWCHRKMEHLVIGSLACEEFRLGEVPARQNHERVPQVQPSATPAPQEHVITCADCLHSETNHGPTPRQGWGRCAKRGKGRHGCAMAGAAALTDDCH
jgi:hypothetical protein